MKKDKKKNPSALSGLGARKNSKTPKAFPSDTYISDLNRASKAGKTWIGLLIPLVIMSFLADFYMLEDSFAWLLKTSSITDLVGGDFDSSEISENIKSICTSFVCIVFVIAYLVFGNIAGKKMAEYRAYHERSSLIAFCLFAGAEIASLALIANVRFISILDQKNITESTGFSSGSGFGSSNGFGSSGGFGESGAADTSFIDPAVFNDAFVETLALVSVMLLGALAGMIYSYYKYNAFAGEKKRLAEAHLADDKKIYESVYAKCVSDPIKNMEYESKERELDGQAVDCAFRISEITAQLNGIVDPADAYDFCTVSKLIGTIKE